MDESGGQQLRRLRDYQSAKKCRTMASWESSSETQG